MPALGQVSPSGYLRLGANAFDVILIRLMANTLFPPLALLLLACSVATNSVQVEVIDARISPAPHGAAVRAAYFDLTNLGRVPVTLIGVRSGAFEKVEIHLTRLVNGVARMRPIAAIDVDVNETISLVPGGRHLMLIRPTRTLPEGASVEMTLCFSDGSEYEAVFQVRR